MLTYLDCSLVPLLVQQNYIDSYRNGMYKSSNISDSVRIEIMAASSQAVSDMDMVGSKVFGVDSHWELLPAQVL